MQLGTASHISYPTAASETVVEVQLPITNAEVTLERTAHPG